MAFNGFSWLSVLQKTKKTLLIWTGDKTRHNQTYQIRSTHRNILSTHIFSIKSFVLFSSLNLWGPFGHDMLQIFVCVCFFTPWYHTFVWHYPKASFYDDDIETTQCPYDKWTHWVEMREGRKEFSPTKEK